MKGTNTTMNGANTTTSKKGEVTMKNEIKTFVHEEFGEVRIVDKDGNPWFVGKDVATMLGYQNSKRAIKMHCSDGVTKCYPIPDAMGRLQKTVIIDEGSFYSLILASKMPKAKAIKAWVCNDVLPSIRKTGEYKLHDKQTKVVPIKTRKEEQYDVAIRGQLKVMEGLIEMTEHFKEVIADREESLKEAVRMEARAKKLEAELLKEQVKSDRLRKEKGGLRHLVNCLNDCITRITARV